MCLFSVVIALFKDIPDVAGDRASAIRTLSVSHGEAPVFRACVALLLTAYAGAAVAGGLSGVPWCRPLLAGAHVAAGVAMWRRSRGVDPSSHESLTAFYMFIWRARPPAPCACLHVFLPLARPPRRQLFYLEYFLIPFFR